MSIRKARKVRLQIESLERRETLSSGLAGMHAIHRPARTSHAFHGSGRTDLVTGAITGNSSQLGSYTGTYFNASNTVVLTTQNGDQVDLAVSGVFKSSSTPSSRGSVKFTVTGGTGHYRGATGHGTMTGTMNTQTESLNFTVNGTLIP